MARLPWLNLLDAIGLSVEAALGVWQKGFERDATVLRHVVFFRTIKPVLRSAYGPALRSRA